MVLELPAYQLNLVHQVLLCGGLQGLQGDTPLHFQLATVQKIANET